MTEGPIVVYVVMWNHWEDTRVCSVHVTEAKAQIEATRLNDERSKKRGNPCHEYDVEEHEVRP